MVGWFVVQNSVLKVNLCHIAWKVPGARLSQGRGAGINFSDSSLVSKTAAGEGVKV